MRIRRPTPRAGRSRPIRNRANHKQAGTYAQSALRDRALLRGVRQRSPGRRRNSAAAGQCVVHSDRRSERLGRLPRRPSAGENAEHRPPRRRRHAVRRRPLPGPALQPLAGRHHDRPAPQHHRHLRPAPRRARRGQPRQAYHAAGVFHVARLFHLHLRQGVSRRLDRPPGSAAGVSSLGPGPVDAAAGEKIRPHPRRYPRDGLGHLPRRRPRSGRLEDL